MEEKTTNNYETKMVSRTVYSDGSEVTVYGLVFTEHDTIIDEFNDITCKKEEIDKLYRIFSENEIDKTHIFDIVCDFIDSIHSVG